jgi:hypothetical protein
LRLPGEPPSVEVSRLPDCLRGRSEGKPSGSEGGHPGACSVLPEGSEKAFLGSSERRAGREVRLSVRLAAVG